MVNGCFKYLFFLGLEPCLFQAIWPSKCPCNDAIISYDDDSYYSDSDDTGCSLKECNTNMLNNDLCEADGPLPDGSTNFEIDNCPGNYDVFKCVKSNHKLYFIIA